MENIKQIHQFKIKNIKPLEIGSILEGIVISKRNQELYVDLSPYGVGRLYGTFYLQCKEIAQKLNSGDQVGVKIIGLNDGYGNYEIVLSSIADTLKWQKLFDYYRRNEILEIEILDANRGGWIVEVEGVKGFIPVSQLSPEYYPRVENSNKNSIYENLKKFIGHKIQCRIIAIDPKQNKLVLSEKAVKEEIYKDILSKLMIGDILTVKVVGHSPFGLFVRFHENPSMDGLIHLSEIPEEKAVDLEKHFRIGDILQAKIIQIRQDKASFSLKNLEPDPWVIFSKNHKEKDIVKGILKEKNEIFGIVEIDKVQGLIFENLDKLEVGGIYQFIIEKLQPKEKSLILKLK